MSHSLVRAALLCTASAVLAQHAFSSFTNPYVPAFRGSPCSDFAQWETFTVAYNGANSPDVAGSNNADATITQLLPGAILTSGGNIYNPFAASAFSLQDSAVEDVQFVSLQVSTNGNPRDYGSFVLVYMGPSGQQNVAPTNFQFLNQVSQHEELLIEWDLTSNPDDITSYSVKFIAVAPSMSLDAAILDTRWSCDPGEAFCFGDDLDPDVTTDCPCQNFGQAGHGCGNSVFTTGALMTVNGTTNPDTVDFTVADVPPGVGTIFLQGNASISMGVIFGDGVRCAGGQLVRLGLKIDTDSDSVTTLGPGSGDAQVSVTGGVIAGNTYYYQTYYRNPNASWCPPATFNISQGIRIAW